METYVVLLVYKNNKKYGREKILNRLINTGKLD
jgi:hypothetical protein